MSSREIIEEKEVEIGALNKEIRENETQIAALKFELDQIKKLLYGKKSERFVADQTEQQLPLDFSGLVIEDSVTEQKQSISYEREKRHKKIKPSAYRIEDHLPRVEHILEPAINTSGMKKIGEVITEELEYKPAQLFVNRFIRPKYVTQHPDDDTKSIVHIAELPTRPIEKGIPGPGLLAHLICSKYVDHLPVYRQCKMMERYGIHLSDSTIYGWMGATATLLEPLYEELKSLVLDMNYLMVDETPIKVLDPKGKQAVSHRGYYWVYYSPLTKQVFFDYQKGRGREGPARLLKDYSGFLQTDGYAAYEQFENHKDITLMGCMAHARRKFIEAQKQDPQRADYVLEKMQYLYGMEKALRENSIKDEHIADLRKTQAVPVLHELYEWLKEHYQQVTPKSAIGKAIAYSLKRWDKLSVYTGQGYLQIDNNLVENAIRPVALGRKNYLFAGSHQAAQNAAMFYSLLATCKHRGINPELYFKSVLSQINDYPVNHLIKLLPGSFETKV